MEDSNSYLVTRSGRHLSRKNLFKEKAHFPFLELPGEIRNMIYKLSLVTDSWVMISDMYPPDFEWLTDCGPPLRRTTYLIDAHDAGDWEAPLSEPNILTTYEYDWCQCGGRISGTPLLSVCRQINTEAIPILYGMNKFALCSAQAIVPFLQDRQPASLAQIKRVRLCFVMDEEGAKRRHNLWTSTVDYIAQKLRLEILDLVVCLFTKFSMAEIRQGALRVQWVESLISIKELKALNVEVDSPESVDDMLSPHRIAPNAAFELEFIAYLESKMLKGKAAASLEQV